ncbi:DNA/RNA non-specific endonuclease [Microbacteriaceae bacterium 4G12]
MTDGYDASFLRLNDPLALPADGFGEDDRVRLDYTHFTVVLDTGRKLAAVTAVNIDGAALVEVERSDDWHLDERVPADQQAGPEVYARNDLDRGHLVRRRDPVWGTGEVARRANSDTFAYTNAAPQAAEFNQSKELWLGLEDYLLDHAATNDQRLSVFTGVVFGADDEEYRGVRIPRMFWKIAAWADGGALATTAYLLDQTPELDRIDLASATADAPPLGPYRTYQVPVEEIGALTGLGVEALAGADRMPAPRPTALPDPGRWVALESWDAIAL